MDPIEAGIVVDLGYEGMKAREAKIPSPAKSNVDEAAERVWPIYKTWGQPDSTEWVSLTM